jgi:valyl-tRNA synthetase
MEESYPKANKLPKFDANQVESLFKMIQDIRNYKVSNKLAPNYKVKLILETREKLFDGFNEYLSKFSFAKDIQIVESSSSKGVKFVYQGITMFIEDDISDEEKAAKKAKDIAFLEAEIKRGESMLSNPNFVSKAPKEKVELEKAKLIENKRRLEELK